MAENKKPVVGLSDKERFPLISDLSFLNKLRQDELAPLFNFSSGDRLSHDHLERVRQYAENIRVNKIFWEKGILPDWIETYTSWCRHTVDFYRNRKKHFLDQPTINRSHISATPWEFVSDDASIEDLLVYQTSGTTGAAMDVVFDPVSQACWLLQLQSILDLYDIKLDYGSDKVAVALICSQSATLTYASLSTYMDGAGVLKINLNPADWKSPVHRSQYLEKYNPQVLTGDPFAFIDLLELKPCLKPKAIVSSAMKLTEGTRKRLEDYFKCPVLDIYSLTECRMVAFADKDRHRAIRHDLYLEIFDEHNDVLLPYGERGELVITGGNNPFLPLIRYRTGDFCSLEIEDGIPYLIDLEARNPVLFYTKDGNRVNNIEISRSMAELPLAGFKMHQSKDFKLTFKGWSNEDLKSEISKGIRTIFGDGIEIEVFIINPELNNGRKVVAYTSDWEG
ncbi:AMP-binding protein [Sporocytophaga myxococcoides]|uniref:AMP-binding protein n=1 Tax=Sporocytophaga myxococcoides TaxID=153721 RepID=UPI0004057555|nr:AMP-binding protein [Sporocytophaga myxococcoides]